MRPLIMLACAAAGILGGGALIGLAALGGCLIFVSLGLAGWVLVTYDWPEPKHAAPAGRVASVTPLAQYLQAKAAEPW